MQIAVERNSRHVHWAYSQRDYEDVNENGTSASVADCRTPNRKTPLRKEHMTCVPPTKLRAHTHTHIAATELLARCATTKVTDLNEPPIIIALAPVYRGGE